MARLNKFERNISKGALELSHQDKLTKARVLVMGLGALSSGVLAGLASLGVGQIKIVDNDIIEENNFNCEFIHKDKNIGRSKVMSAKNWIEEYNPDIKVEIIKTCLDERNFQNIVDGYDIIVDCFDDIETKYFLNKIAYCENKTLIYGSIKDFQGYVTTISPNKTGCLECFMPYSSAISSEQKCAYLSPIANTIASLEVLEVLKLATGKGTPLFNKVLFFSGLNSEFRTINFSKNLSCSVCSRKGEY